MREKYLFIDKPLSQLQEEIKGDRSEKFKRLYELARVYKEVNLPDVHPEKSTTFMGFAAFNLSLLYILTRQKEYLVEAKRWIFTAVKYPHWGNAFLVDVDLSASFILFGLSLSYDWLKDELTEEEEKMLREKLHLQATRMYDFKIANNDHGWATAFYQNHNWINMTGLAAAGYALREHYPDTQKFIEESKENFKKVYEYMADDGSDYEGVVYWRYGVIWLYIYGHLIKTEENIDFFKTCNFMKNTFYYRLYQAMPNLEEIAHFGDCHDKRSGHSTAIYYKVASEYGNEHAQYLGNRVSKEFLYREQYESKVKPGILPETGFEFLWYDPKVKERTFDDLPTTKYFEDLGLVVMRDSWKEDAFHFSFKCGLAGGKKQFETSFKLQKELGHSIRGLSHQHPDNGHFILHANDTYLTTDEGYNRTVKASDHSLITVDGKGYRNEGQNNVWHDLQEHHTASLDGYFTNDKLTYFRGNTPNVYEDEVKLSVYNRHVLYTNSNHVYVIDEVDSELEHTYTYHLQTECKAEVVNNGEFKYVNGPGKMDLYMTSSKEYSNKLGNTYVKAIMTSQEPDVFRETNMDTLFLENKAKSKGMDFISLMKTASIFDESEFKVETVEGLGFKTDKELMLFSTSDIKHGDIETDAKLIFVIEGKYVFATGVSYIKIGGKDVFKADAKQENFYGEV